MELILVEESNGSHGMKLCHKTMLEYFKDTITFKNYWGPEHMCAIHLEYEYIPTQYKISIECERGFLTIQVNDSKGNRFSPNMIYPEACKCFFEDKNEDIEQLITYTYKAIITNEITFVSPNK